MSTEPATSLSDENRIRTVHATWIEAVNAGLLAELLAMMTQDVVLINPGREPFGREVFSETFSAAHQRNQIHCVSELEEVVVVADVAYTRSKDSLAVTQRPSSEVKRFAGYRMTVYRKQTDGRWLLARDVHTLAPVST